MMKNQKAAGSIKTVWELRTYDVWGNARDGYEVNNTFRAGEVELRIPQTRYNADTEHEFKGAYPTDRQIKRAFGVSCRISTDGDDLTVYVERKRDCYPIGELHCTSHVSLSPVRHKNAVPMCAACEAGDHENAAQVHLVQKCACACNTEGRKA